MAEDDLELRAKLRVTQEGEGELRRVRGELEQTGEAAEHAQHQMGFLEHSLSNFAAIELGEVVEKVKELGREFLSAADDAQSADLAVGSLIAAAQGTEWGQARQEAAGLREELDGIGIDAHQSAASVSQAFQQMLEITGATERGVRQATTATEELSKIASLLGDNVADSAGEFAMMEEGVVRTRGHLFHLLNTTGIFGDNVKKAAAGWQALTDEERSRRLTYAMDQLSQSADKAEPTFAQLRQSASDIVEQFAEGLGMPLLDAINPEFKRFVSELKQGIPVIEDFGREMSVDVQRWVHEAADEVQQGFEYLKAHGKEIHDEIVSAVDTVKRVVEWVLDHKEELALAFGAKTAIGVAGGLARGAAEGPLGKGVELFVEGAKKVYAMGAAQGATGAFTSEAVPGVATVGNALAGGAVGGVAALGAVGAAIGGIVAAGYQLSELFEDTSKDTRQTFDAVRAGMKDMASENTEWTDVEVAAFDRMRANLLESAQYLGEDVGAAVQFSDALQKSHAAHVANMKSAEDLAGLASAFEVLALSSQYAAEDAKTAGEQAAAAKEGAHVDEVAAQDVGLFTSTFEALMAGHDTAAAQYSAHILASSKNLFASFLASAQMSDEGFEALAKAVEAGGAEFKDQAQAIRDLIGSKEHQKMQVHFNMPGAKIAIQQDFRDQDPDNVAIVFQRDLVRAAVNRLGSAFTVPFGT